LRHVTTDAKCRIFITRESLPVSVRTTDSIVIDLSSEPDTPARNSATATQTHVTAQSPAYVMFTSGSTGRPKGAVIPHRAVIRLVRDQSYVPFDSSQRTLFLASPAFDAATFEIWGPLLNGGTCVIFPEKWPDLEDLENTIREKEVSCVWLTAGLFNQIIDHRPTVLNTVRYAITGGEALSVSHVKSALQLLPNLSLVNGYGPTESTTFACTHPISRNEVIGSSVPIGRPLANTSCYILDCSMALVPIGVTGELCIGGDGLADGYLNQPELTAEKFITNPFGKEPADRLYRTGDQCRWLPNGNIEFLGRSDDQL
jgi:amino acid adenylation domain-containing protein